MKICKGIIFISTFFLVMPCLQGESEYQESLEATGTSTLIGTNNVKEQPLLRSVVLEDENREIQVSKENSRRNADSFSNDKEKKSAEDLASFLNSERSKLDTLEKKFKKLEGLTQESRTAKYFQASSDAKQQKSPGKIESGVQAQGTIPDESVVPLDIPNLHSLKKLDVKDGASTVNADKAKDRKKDKTEIDSVLEHRIVSVVKESGALIVAESYYKLREYDKALQAYKKITPDDLSKEQYIWSQYQIANCYRGLKKFDDAQKEYQNVILQFPDSYLIDQAKWLIEDIGWWKDWYEKNKLSNNQFIEIPKN